jgi:hypothetical protein
MRPQQPVDDPIPFERTCKHGAITLIRCCMPWDSIRGYRSHSISFTTHRCQGTSRTT